MNNSYMLNSTVPSNSCSRMTS